MITSEIISTQPFSATATKIAIAIVPYQCCIDELLLVKSPPLAREGWVGRNQTILFFKGASEVRDKRTIELHAFIFPLTKPSPFGEGLCFLPVNTTLKDY